MVFTTFTFLVFLCIVFPIYWTRKTLTGQNLTILISSYVFYGWWDWRFCFLMLFSSVVDYYASLRIAGSESEKSRRGFLMVSLVANLGLLGFFKYFNFFVDSAAAGLEALGLQAHLPTLYIVLPVGISFYTFQTLGYTIDVYRGTAKPCRRIVDYLAYVSFFPQLVAGPIERASNLLPQMMTKRVFDADMATDGCRQILWGAFKKMVIADNLAAFVELAFANPQNYSGARLLIATVFFAFQIYCDFSGYSDIAIGLAKTFRIRLMRNFALPYFSQTMDEFWRRWHISLSTWFRDYVYIPLGGSRVGRATLARNIMITFVLSGLWHGASWNFIAWGAINGLAIVPVLYLRRDAKRANPGRPPGGDSLIPTPLAVIRIAATFALVCAGWVFFRSLNISDAFLILGRIMTWGSVPDGLYPAELLGAIPIREMAAWVVFLVALEWLQKSKEHPLELGFLPSVIRWIVYTAFIWTILYRGTLSSGAFIYFQF